MGRYINGNEDKHALAISLGAAEVGKQEARGVFNTTDKAALVWVDNGFFQALAYAYTPAEFDAFTEPGDNRRKRFYVIDKAVAEANAR
jgi:hypothetical protein